MADSKVSLLAAVTTIGDTDDLYVAVGGASKRITGANARMTLTPLYAHVIDQKAQGVNGGTFTSGAWRQRDLNTTVEDVGAIVASLATNRITLVAGTYRCRIRVPAYNCGRVRSRLFNFTDSVAVLPVGSSTYINGTAGDTWIRGKFTIAASKELQIEQVCQTTAATHGFGVSLGDTVSGYGVEVYTEAEFWLIG